MAVRDGFNWDDAHKVADFKVHQGGKTVLKLPTGGGPQVQGAEAFVHSDAPDWVTT